MSFTRQVAILCAATGALTVLLWSMRGPAVEQAQPAAQGAVCGQSTDTVTGYVTDVQFIDPEAAHALAAAKPGAVFVDCRSEGEYRSGHIAGSMRIPAEVGTVPPQLAASLREAATVIAYCDNGCERSSRMAALIASEGATDVRIMRGGMPAWLEHELPAESGP